MKNTASFLPLFGGFYETIFQLDTDNFLYEEKLDWEDIDVDINQYEKDVAKQCCDWVEDNCEFINKVTFEEVISPKYYNFSNDSINCTIDVDVEAFAAYLIENEEALDKWLKEKYTSRSGFISSYSNSFAEWKEETNGFIDLAIDGHRLGTLLNFYYDNEYDNEYESAYDDMAYYVMESTYEGNYISSNLKHVDNLEDYEKKIVARNLLEDMEEPFGYMEVLINEYKLRADGMGIDWRDLLADNEYEEVIKASGYKKFKLNMLEI